MVVTPFGPIATQSGPRGESSRSYPTVASPSFLARASSRSRASPIASSIVISSHRRFHFLQRLAHPSARRFLAALERQGDLRVGETLELAQHERRALPRWQGLDRQREIREGRVIPLRRRECQVIDVRDDPPHPPLAVDRAVPLPPLQPASLLPPPLRSPHAAPPRGRSWSAGSRGGRRRAPAAVTRHRRTPRRACDRRWRPR